MRRIGWSFLLIYLRTGRVEEKRFLRRVRMKSQRVK